MEGGIVTDRQFFAYLKIFFRAAAGSGVVWVVLRFLLPWTAPMVLAFLLAAAFEPIVRSMVKRGWRRRFASAAVTLSVLAFLSFITVWLASRAVSAVSELLKNVPSMMESALNSLRELRRLMLSYTLSAPESVRQYFDYTADALEKSLYSIPTELSQRVMGFVASAVQATPDVLLFIVTAGIGSYFVSASYPNILSFIRRQFSKEHLQRANSLRSDFAVSFGGLIRAQLILMLITFFELLAAFYMLRLDSIVLPAALTALVDALPVFGVGTVLVPWALWMALGGQYGRAVCMLAVWGVITLVRNCLQAKLVADQTGLDPVVSLLAVYTGWRIAGVAGMLLFPLIFVIVCRLNSRGVIQLWKE